MEDWNQAAKWRWLKPAEVFNCLMNWEDSKVILSFPSLPNSGFLCFVQKSLFRTWKKDGHSYRKRRSEQGVREDRDKYTQCEETIQCIYTHGSGICPKCKTQGGSGPCRHCGFSFITPTSFHRRAYWLVSAPDRILVHYLDEKEEFSSEGETQGSISDTFSVAGTEDPSIPLIEIVDFSPEWDTVEGGVKVLICIDPPIGRKTDLQCVFGAIPVPGELIQSGVIRCWAPAHSVGSVDLLVSLGGKDITREKRVFEYREVARKRPNDSESVSCWDISEQEFKVRIVERLESLSKDVDSTGPDMFSDDLFENMIVSALKRLVRLKAKVNGQDRHGFALIHYLAAVNYWHALQIFELENIPVHVATKTGLTALDIAQHFNHHCSVSVLLMCETDLKADPLDDMQDLLKVETSFTEELQARQTDEAFVKKVQTIQKNVRMWAIRRHYCGIKNATMTLQRCIRALLARKQFKDQRKAAITIQKTVRNWLQGSHFNP